MAKHSHKTRYTTVKIGVGPTKERRRHNGGVMVEIIDRAAGGKALIKRFRAVWECPLDVYRDAKVINEAEHRAGLKFRQAYFQSVIRPRTTYGRINSNDNRTPTHSDKLLKEAYMELPSENRDVVIAVCGHDQIIWSQKALDKLRKGLGHLAMQWDMMAIEICEHNEK
jgi:hypothetical protein